MKCFVIPVIIGVTGTVTKGLRRYPETISGKQSTDSLQENSCMGGIAHNKDSAII
jgi:hypothetical protein